MLVNALDCGLDVEAHFLSIRNLDNRRGALTFVSETWECVRQRDWHENECTSSMRVKMEGGYSVKKSIWAVSRKGRVGACDKGLLYRECNHHENYDQPYWPTKHMSSCCVGEWGGRATSEAVLIRRAIPPAIQNSPSTVHSISEHHDGCRSFVVIRYAYSHQGKAYAWDFFFFFRENRACR